MKCVEDTALDCEYANFQIHLRGDYLNAGGAHRTDEAYLLRTYKAPIFHAIMGLACVYVGVYATTCTPRSRYLTLCAARIATLQKAIPQATCPCLRDLGPILTDCLGELQICHGMGMNFYVETQVDTRDLPAFTRTTLSLSLSLSSLLVAIQIAFL